ncbi:uncharacterized protein LTR77_002007 [Saxophila tyrrhenica]|uniref:Uncharacterized protein n=1 Tax=Saxophila tyrrhenica TaxID=1690608 RepID=A0AAV9PM75_9PEZI|nr:hypothetical protein LTR77_002007 [Saxophila tyrrhenica]
MFHFTPINAPQRPPPTPPRPTASQADADDWRFEDIEDETNSSAYGTAEEVFEQAGPSVASKWLSSKSSVALSQPCALRISPSRSRDFGPPLRTTSTSDASSGRGHTSRSKASPPNSTLGPRGEETADEREAWDLIESVFNDVHSSPSSLARSPLLGYLDPATSSPPAASEPSAAEQTVTSPQRSSLAPPAPTTPLDLEHSTPAPQLPATAGPNAVTQPSARRRPAREMLRAEQHDQQHVRRSKRTVDPTSIQLREQPEILLLERNHDWPVSRILQHREDHGDFYLLEWEPTAIASRFISRRDDGRLFVSISSEAEREDAYISAWNHTPDLDDDDRVYLVRWTPTWEQRGQLKLAEEKLREFEECHFVRGTRGRPAEVEKLDSLQFVPEDGKDHRLALRNKVSSVGGALSKILARYHDEHDRRPLLFRPGRLRKVNAARQCTLRALLAHVRGIRQTWKCHCCENGQGNLPECVVVQGEFGDGCTNCAISAADWTRCEYHQRFAGDRWIADEADTDGLPCPRNLLTPPSSAINRAGAGHIADDSPGSLIRFPYHEPASPSSDPEYTAASPSYSSAIASSPLDMRSKRKHALDGDQPAGAGNFPHSGPNDHVTDFQVHNESLEDRTKRRHIPGTNMLSATNNPAHPRASTLPSNLSSEELAQADNPRRDFALESISHSGPSLQPHKHSPVSDTSSPTLPAVSKKRACTSDVDTALLSSTSSSAPAHLQHTPQKRRCTSTSQQAYRLAARRDRAAQRAARRDAARPVLVALQALALENCRHPGCKERCEDEKEGHACRDRVDKPNDRCHRVVRSDQLFGRGEASVKQVCGVLRELPCSLTKALHDAWEHAQLHHDLAHDETKENWIARERWEVLNMAVARFCPAAARPRSDQERDVVVIED